MNKKKPPSGPTIRPPPSNEEMQAMQAWVKGEVAVPHTEISGIPVTESSITQQTDILITQVTKSLDQVKKRGIVERKRGAVRRFVLYLDPDRVERLRLMAFTKESNVSALVDAIIEEWLKNH